MKSAAIMSLQHILGEMDAALAAEIKAQEKGGASYKRFAVDGRPLGEQSGKYLYHYNFTLNDLWEVNDDTPIKIRVNSNPEISAMIVTANGTAITIATEEPLS